MPRRIGAALLVLGVAALVALALSRSDAIRDRSSAALGNGLPAREAALARGFVLGEDEGIDARTVEDFRRAGLGHLLAVSGQNVALLALLAWPLLAAFGLALRARLFWLLGLIVVYVAVAGAGPSIQRAGVMGALNLLAALAGRRASRLYALALAALVTLAVDPAIAADVGWQLSFAAVLGILALAAPLRRAIAARLGARGWHFGLAEGAAMTIAATLATAPLAAFHFGGFSTTTLLANLLVLPAVAPAMWLGMLAASGQVPGFPVEVLNALNAPLLAYVAQIAAWCGRPSWAYAQVELGIGGLAASYALIVVGVAVLVRVVRRRRVAAARGHRVWRQARPGLAQMRPVAALLGLALLLGVEWGALAPHWDAAATGPPPGLRISVLDVGQGDAILLQPRRGEAILVDTGPPGEDLPLKLRAAGVERLGAVVLSHDQADHAGGLGELFGHLPIGRLLYGVLDEQTREAANAAGVVPVRLVAGQELRSAALRLEVLWPPAELLAAPPRGEDPNRLSLVLRLRWHDFSMLLGGDAEAGVVSLDPGPLDVLKVAHHGSEDAALAALLAKARPSLAVVSVGADNPFGHPAATTLATLAAGGVQTLRTDLHGTLVLDVRRGAFEVELDG